MVDRVLRHVRWRRDRLRWQRHRLLQHTADWLTSLGERRQSDWLIYNPSRMLIYNAYAKVDADTLASALTTVFPAARSFADVGSGTSAFAAELVRRGLDVQACERSRVGRLISRMQGVRPAAFDLARKPPAKLRSPVDVAYCFEVAEHLSPDLGDELVRYLCTLAPIIIFTAAPSGQGGSGHVNEQPRGYWIERFDWARFWFDEQTSRVLRDEMQTRGLEQSWWLAENSMVFRSG